MDVVQIAVWVALAGVAALLLWRVVRVGIRMGLGVSGMTLLFGGLVFVGYLLITSWLGISLGLEWDSNL